MEIFRKMKRKMFSGLKSFSADNNAQVMVEFLIVFPVVITLIFGILEFTFLSLVHQNVAYAAFNAARAEIVGLKGHRSAWMSLFAMAPHRCGSMSPKTALITRSPTLQNLFKGDDDLGHLVRMITGSDCAVEVVEFIEQTGIVKPQETGSAVVDIINFILGKMVIGDEDLLYTDEEEGGDTGTSDDLPLFVRKAAYAMAFSDVDVEKVDDEQAPAVKVYVTYYYPLKFPVIRKLIRFALEKGGWEYDPERELFTGTGNKWTMANIFSEKSGMEFVPVTHWCMLGDEKSLI